MDSIIPNHNIPEQVFAGTDWGLYYTDNIAATTPVWMHFQNGLPLEGSYSQYHFARMKHYPKDVQIIVMPASDEAMMP